MGGGVLCRRCSSGSGACLPCSRGACKASAGAWRGAACAAWCVQPTRHAAWNGGCTTLLAAAAAQLMTAGMALPECCTCLVQQPVGSAAECRQPSGSTLGQHTCAVEPAAAMAQLLRSARLLRRAQQHAAAADILSSSETSYQGFACIGLLAGLAPLRCRQAQTPGAVSHQGSSLHQSTRTASPCAPATVSALSQAAGTHLRLQSRAGHSCVGMLL